MPLKQGTMPMNLNEHTPRVVSTLKDITATQLIQNDCMLLSCVLESPWSVEILIVYGLFRFAGDVCVSHKHGEEPTSIGGFRVPHLMLLCFYNHVDSIWLFHLATKRGLPHRGQQLNCSIFTASFYVDLIHFYTQVKWSKDQPYRKLENKCLYMYKYTLRSCIQITVLRSRPWLSPWSLALWNHGKQNAHSRADSELLP